MEREVARQAFFRDLQERKIYMLKKKASQILIETVNEVWCVLCRPVSCCATAYFSLRNFTGITESLTRLR